MAHRNKAMAYVDNKKASLWILPLWLFVLLFPVNSFADGKVIPQTVFAVPDIPNQQALIHYANGLETLVIETSFVGKGSNFAWVVPLPAVAKIAPVSLSTSTMAPAQPTV